MFKAWGEHVCRKHKFLQIEGIWNRSCYNAKGCPSDLGDPGLKLKLTIAQFLHVT